MKLSVVASVFAAVVGLTSAEHVAHLGDDDFDDHVAKHKFALVELYAPWCGHCKQLAPEYEKAAEHFATVADPVEGGLTLIAVDATEHKALASKYEVQGFPTLIFLVDGEKQEYNGGRSKDEIVSWLNKKTGPPAKEITDEDGLTKFKASGDVTVFAYVSSTDSELFKAYEGAAQSTDDASFAYSTSVSAGLDADTVVVFRNFEGEEPQVKCEDATKAGIKKCVAANMLPLVVPFSQQNAPKIFGGAIKQHVLVFLDNSASNKDEVMGMVRPVATEKKGDYLFVTVDKSDDRIMEFFGITEGDLPTARIVVMGDAMKKYAIEGDLSEDNLRTFVTAHTAGELKQALKSEADIPDSEQPKEGNVWILTGKNFDRVVDKTKEGVNILAAFVAPWCGHCKKLYPEWEKVSDHYKDDDKVILAKMDATANEVERVSVSGFPTLKFFPAGSDEMVDFDGGRDEAGIKKFIEDNRK